MKQPSLPKSIFDSSFLLSDNPWGRSFDEEVAIVASEIRSRIFLDDSCEVSMDQVLPRIANRRYKLLVESLFKPFTERAVLRKGPVITCPREKFVRKFNITSNIITDSVQSILEDGNGSIILCGGKLVDFMLNKTAEESKGDYDFWSISSDQTLFELFQRFNEDTDNYLSLTHTERCWDFWNKAEQKRYQIIREYDFCSVNDIFDRFDIRFCCIAYDGQNFYWRKDSIRDLINRDIILNSFNPTRVGFKRIHKYISRGFGLSKVDFLLFSLCELSYAMCGNEEFFDLCTNREYDVKNYPDNRYLGDYNR